jgi:hypothetical protein
MTVTPPLGIVSGLGFSSGAVKHPGPQKPDDDDLRSVEVSGLRDREPTTRGRFTGVVPAGG